MKAENCQAFPPPARRQPTSLESTADESLLAGVVHAGQPELLARLAQCGDVSADIGDAAHAHDADSVPLQVDASGGSQREHGLAVAFPFDEYRHPGHPHSQHQ
jgi:hypothetical protein